MASISDADITYLMEMLELAQEKGDMDKVSELKSILRGSGSSISDADVSKTKNIMKFKDGGFPDLTGDGKVTQKDILKGRGVPGFKDGKEVSVSNEMRGARSAIKGRKFSGVY
tara:strand:+ start:506 stop:844 length:339 start_codon:yes stop_codon:yes gene_type:complete